MEKEKQNIKDQMDLYKNLFMQSSEKTFSAIDSFKKVQIEIASIGIAAATLLGTNFPIKTFNPKFFFVTSIITFFFSLVLGFYNYHVSIFQRKRKENYYWELHNNWHSFFLGDKTLDEAERFENDLFDKYNKLQGELEGNSWKYQRLFSIAGILSLLMLVLFITI